MVDPGPQFLRQYLNPLRDEDSESQGHPQAQGSRDSPARARTSADLATDDPSYLGLPDETLSQAVHEFLGALGSVERERGDGRNIPQGSVSTTISQTTSVVAQIVNETGPVGVMATYIDDGAFVGLPEAAPEIPAELEDEMDRHTSEEDGVSRGPLVTDPVAIATSPEIRASVGETSHHDRPPIFPCIYPGWRLRTPPQEMWPPLPDWGGAEALWHQVIPRGVAKDFSYWSLDRNVLIRFHAAPRRRMYIFAEATLPSGLNRSLLTGRRRSFVQFENPRELTTIDDSISDARPQRQLARQWTGRTEFELLPR